MKKSNKLMILIIVLVVIIALLTLVMVFDFDVLLFKNLSLSGIEEKKLEVETLIKERDTENANYVSTLENLKQAENSYDIEKEKYENIPESDISIVQQATIDEKYFIEYLWVVLGNYAKTNNLAINIITPGALYATASEKNDDKSTEQSTNSNNTEDNKSEGNTQNSTPKATATASGEEDEIKIIVRGRYSDLADFVFDVENDSSLRFKLDNIKMIYSGDNKVEATFDVLSLSVLN